MTKHLITPLPVSWNHSNVNSIATPDPAIR